MLHHNSSNKVWNIGYIYWKQNFLLELKINLKFLGKLKKTRKRLSSEYQKKVYHDDIRPTFISNVQINIFFLM